MNQRVGLLVSGQEYYMPYLQWATSCKLFQLSGMYAAKTPWIDAFSDKVSCVDNEEWIFNNSDLVLSFGFWKKIPQILLEKVPLGTVNVHHSYKLRYRGRHTCSWAIINNEEYHGSTIHYMNENIDDGPIINTKKIRIKSDDTAETLFNKVNSVGLELLQDSIKSILSNKVAPQQADKNYYVYRERDLQHDLTDIVGSPHELYRHVRALTYEGKPKPFIRVNGQKIFLLIGD